MAQKTFAAMTTAVTNNCKRTDSSTIIQGKIQDAVKRILNTYNFPLLEDISTVATADGVATSAFPTLFKELYNEKSVTSGVSGESDYLTVRSPGQFIEDHPKPDEDTEAMPTEVMIFENLFYWWPIPDATYSIRIHYFKYHAVFDASTSHTLGEQADYGIECIATAMVYETFQEYDDSAYWYALGWDDLRKLNRRNNDIDGRVAAVSGSLYPGSRAGGSATADKTDYGRIK